MVTRFQCYARQISGGVGGAIIGAAALMAGILPSYATADPAEQEVGERAEERWGALRDGDFEGAYFMTSPSFRSATTYEQFRNRFGGSVRWKDAEVMDTQCENERCTVYVALSYEVIGQPFGNTRTIKETWIHSRGEWWHHPN